MTCLELGRWERDQMLKKPLWWIKTMMTGTQTSMRKPLTPVRIKTQMTLIPMPTTKTWLRKNSGKMTIWACGRLLLNLLETHLVKISLIKTPPCQVRLRRRTTIWTCGESQRRRGREGHLCLSGLIKVQQPLSNVVKVQRTLPKVVKAQQTLPKVALEARGGRQR